MSDEYQPLDQVQGGQAAAQHVDPAFHTTILLRDPAGRCDPPVPTGLRGGGARAARGSVLPDRCQVELPVEVSRRPPLR